MIEWLPALLAGITLVLVLWLLLRRGDEAPLARAVEAIRQSARADAERLERELRDEVARSGSGTRQEMGQTLAGFQRTLLAQSGEVARTQNEQIDAFRVQLAAMQQAVTSALQGAASLQATQAQAARDAQDVSLARFGDAMGEQLRALSQANEQRLLEVRTTVEQRLTALQADNEKKLEQMRATVDEKLHATLETRLAASFQQVAERLEQVHKGLGDMRDLARDVGSLNRVLTNVKSRGVFGEMQLAGLLEQVLATEQYAKNVETIPNTGARVEFAIKLPGRRDDGVPLWLPIDAKFPREDYERLVEAQERADPVAVEASAKAIEVRLRAEAKTIREKYIAAPHTTDFGIMFVPTEGLYAEALRRPGLVEGLQREHKVMLAGPTTLLATLNSLQMGFRTLALEKRSAEVWEVLGAVKTEFAKFGAVLSKIRGQAETVVKTVGEVETRTRQMGKALKTVESLPDAQAATLLPGVEASPAYLPLADDDVR